MRGICAHVWLVVVVAGVDKATESRAVVPEFIMIKGLSAEVAEVQPLVAPALEPDVVSGDHERAP